MFLQKPQSREGCGTAGGRDGGRENERPRVVADVVADELGRRHVAAEARERLGEGAHDDVHLVLEPEVAGRAAAALADDAEAVGVVHHDARAVLFRQVADLRQLCDVAAHGEHAVGDDEAARGLRHGLQLGLEVVHVRVAVAEHLAEGEAAAVVDAGVVLAVADDVVAAADEGADDAEVGLEARREGDGAILVHEVGQLALQLEVEPERAVQKARAGAAGAVFRERSLRRRDHLRRRREAQVVVGAEHDAALALHDDFGVLPRLERVEIGVDAPLPALARRGVRGALSKQIHVCLQILKKF